MSDGTTVEITVRGIASGGAGVGDLPDGRVVFVPRTAPGDRARIRIEKQKARWAVGSLRRVVDPAPDRVDPVCPLYAECGGCQLQHLSYEKQLEWKGRFVVDALTRVGGLSEVAAPEVVPSPTEIRYRDRMSFTLRRLRGGRVVAGLHGLARPAHVVDVTDECVLPVEGLSEAWVRLRAAWGRGARLLPDGGRLRLTLRVVSGGHELVVEGGAGGWRAEALLGAVPDLVAVHHVPGKDGKDVTVTDSDDPVLGSAFQQVNAAAAEALRAHVADVVGAVGSAVDAYSGVGDFAAVLAAGGARVVGIELDAGAVAVARGRDIEGLEVVQGAVETELAAHLPTELLLVNPPRTGLADTVRTAILAAPAERIVYVSCDPATLGRDVGALSAEYELEGVRCFDLFPQTAHVETVAVLTKKASA